MNATIELSIGLVIGVVAKLIMPGNTGGIIVTSLIGVAWFIATYAGRALGWYHEGQSALHHVSNRGHRVAGVIHLVKPRGSPREHSIAVRKVRDAREGNPQHALDTGWKQ